MLEELKQKVFKANLDLVKQGLVIFTWGNVSGMYQTKNQEPFAGYGRIHIRAAG